jgi:energy-coupling factor transporter ATP-binding protein EcfA2
MWVKTGKPPDFLKRIRMQLTVTDLGKQYKSDFWGIKAFSLLIKPGILGLIGPNGAGKSTFMRMLATITKPTNGTIILGVLFEQRGPVLGAAFGVMFGGMIIETIFPQINYILPLSMDQFALSVSQGQALPAMAVSQVVMTAVWSVIFLVTALRRFQRIEL